MLKLNKVVKAALLSVLVTAGIIGLAVAGNPARSLLTPSNHSLIMIDHQPQMAFATRSHTLEGLLINVTLVVHVDACHALI
ncbi:hypothetical protein [Alishewanella sp. HL-SH05]|uniref:hypothetical protein n=1 Tax=Alishewanella sp. HL-SH05 TaxID=3461145 RepID=UPI0040424BF9